MKKRLSSMVVVWVVLAIALAWAFVEHGRMLGGVKYFAHMGRGPAAAAELVLIVGCLLLAALHWSSSSAVKPVGWVVAVVAFAFSLSFFPSFLPLPRLIEALNPYVFPFGVFGVLLPGIVMLLALSSSVQSRGE
jgi:hypothetical protein